METQIARPVWASRVYAHLEFDLLSMESRPSLGNKYILTVIDVYSRYAASIPMTNKTGATTARHFKTICQLWSLDKYGSVVSSDRGSEFIAPETQAVLQEFGLKHVMSKAWKSQAQGIVERYQQNLRSSIGKWRSATGRSDWSRVLPDLVFSYNASVHSTIGVEPSVAVHQSLSGDQEMIDYIRIKSFRAAKKSMSQEGPMLEKGDLVRISIYAISNEARRQVKSNTKKGRKNSEMENWTRQLFVIRSRSAGTPLQHKQYRVNQGQGLRLRGLFWRHELMKVNKDELRSDVVDKISARDPHADLETAAVEALTVDANVLDNGEKRQISKEAARWIGALVAKMFEEGLYRGKVVDHIPDLDEDLEDDSERWVIEYDKTGKKEAVDSEELLAILAGAAEQEQEEEEEEKEEDPDNLQETKEEEPSKPKKQVTDPLIGRKVKTWMDIDDDEEVQVKGKIISKSQKKTGKKKGAYYEILWNHSKYEIQNEKVHVSDIKSMLT